MILYQMRVKKEKITKKKSKKNAYNLRNEETIIITVD